MSIKERWKGFEPLPKNIKERLAALKPLFREEGILLVYLFGSLNRGRGGEDVDLAFLPPGEGMGGLRPKIWKALGTERVDLVNLKTTSPTSRFEIVCNGTIIYKANDEVENQFELSALRGYKDTNHLRRKQVEILREDSAVVLKKDLILERLRELDTVLEELNQ